MEPTVPESPDANNFATVMSTISTAVDNMARHQADATRAAGTANVEMARIEAEKQVELSRIASKTQERAMEHGVRILYLSIGLVTALVTAAFVSGHLEIATHTITAAAGVAAGWLARSRR